MKAATLMKQSDRKQKELMKVLLKLERAGVLRLGDGLRRAGWSAPKWTKEELSQIRQRLRSLQLSTPYVRPVQRPPGWQLRRFTELVFSRKAYALVLEPTLADLQAEHFDALAEGRLWKARIVLIRGYISFWSAIAALLPVSLARRAFELWKATKIR